MNGQGRNTTEAPINDRAAAQAGFEQFVAAHGDRLLHAAFALCGDWQSAEDLVQQVLLKLARRWESITGSPRGYAYRCLAHANVDRWRVLRRRRETVTDPVMLVDLPATPVAVDDRLTVVAALQHLPARRRAIVVLRYLHDLSEADTAAALGISVGAVKSGAARGLAQLRGWAETARISFEEVDR